MSLYHSAMDPVVDIVSYDARHHNGVVRLWRVDVENDPLNVDSVVGAPVHAISFTLNNDGSFTYVHDGSAATPEEALLRQYAAASATAP